MTRVAIPARTKKALTTDLGRILTSIDAVSVKDIKSIQQFSADLVKVAASMNALSSELNKLVVIPQTSTSTIETPPAPPVTPVVPPSGQKVPPVSVSTTNMESTVTVSKGRKKHSTSESVSSTTVKPSMIPVPTKSKSEAISQALEDDIKSATSGRKRKVKKTKQ